MLAVVKRILATNAENKAIGNIMETNINHNSSIVTADCIPVVPQIPVVDATTANTSTQRIGDRIKPKSLVVKGTASIRTGSFVTNQCIYVRVLILAQKNLKTGAQVLSGADTAHLLRPSIPGVGLAEQPFNGFTINLDYPVNKDLFRVYYDKTFKLGGPGGAVANPENPSGCARWRYRFKKLPASLTFDDGNGDWANNFAPFYCVGYAYADGTSPDVTARLTTNTYSHLEFEDS